MPRKKETALQHLVNPLIPEFSLHDIVQVIIGASILAVPVGFTEETWKLGENLPIINILALLALSITFITIFTYYQYHKHLPDKHRHIFAKRVIATYILSFFVVSLILTIIQRAPWVTDTPLALSRVVIVTFPSSMSAAIADTLK